MAVGVYLDRQLGFQGRLPMIALVRLHSISLLPGNRWKILGRGFLGRDENAYQGYRSKVDLYQEWSGWISDAGPESVERLKLCLSINAVGNQYSLSWIHGQLHSAA